MDDEDEKNLSRAEQEARFLIAIEKVDPDTRLAIEKMILWMVERPKDAEEIEPVQYDQMIEEIRLENIRRRLGGKVGVILPFTRKK